MSTHRHIDAVCVVVLVFTLLITVLFMNGKALGIQPIVDEDAEEFDGSGYFTANDRNSNWNTTGATQITLRGDRASVSGGGAFSYGSNVFITGAGKYAISGSMENGSIVVDTDSTSKVWLLLDGVEIRNGDGACLDIEQADKVFLTLAEGKENSMTSTGFSEEALQAKADGALFSRDDLTINGTGSLSVTSNSEHGITVNDEFVITGGRITVTAARDAIHANDSFRLMDAGLNLKAGDDGVSVTGLESELYMESGSVSIKAEDNGISAGNSITLKGGMINVDAGDDGISASGTILIEDGELTIRAADDGIRSDTAVSVGGGSLLVSECYEGIEAVTIEVRGGDITIFPEDDGLNANGGTDGFMNFGGGFRPADIGKTPPGFGEDGTERPEPPTGGEGPTEMKPPEDLDQEKTQDLPALPAPPDKQNSPEAIPERPDGDNMAEETAGNEKGSWIHISGGSVTVINDTARDADGLDSNGDIMITGGIIRVSLTNSGMNSALDYGSENGGVMEISGGELVACGSYSMAEGFDSSSTQCSVLYNLKRGAPAGTTVCLEDRDGKVLLSYEVPCSFSSAMLSCPELQIGESYTVVIGDSVEEIVIEKVSASFGDAESEGFSGPMNWGGMKFRPKG